jgi:hypothetical protein
MQVYEGLLGEYNERGGIAASVIEHDGETHE